MKNLKFKRYNVGEVFDPTTAERDTIHFVPVSTEPLVVKMYDVDEFGNLAEISFDGWQENKDIFLKQLEEYEKQIELIYNAKTIKLPLLNDFPTDPVAGEICFKDGIHYGYDGTEWKAFY